MCLGVYLDIGSNWRGMSMDVCWPQAGCIGLTQACSESWTTPGSISCDMEQSHTWQHSHRQQHFGTGNRDSHKLIYRHIHKEQGIKQCPQTWSKLCVLATMTRCFQIFIALLFFRPKMSAIERWDAAWCKQKLIGCIYSMAYILFLLPW